jgi:hypothetical protein
MTTDVRLENEKAKRAANVGSVLVRETINSEHGLPVPCSFRSYAFYGVVEVFDDWISCVHLITQVDGSTAKEQTISSPYGPLAFVKSVRVGPSEQCLVARGEPVSFKQAVVSEFHRHLAIARPVTFTEQEPFTRWFPWDPSSILVEETLSLVHPLVPDSKIDELMINAMTPAGVSVYPPDPSIATDMDPDAYRFWFSEWMKRNRDTAVASAQVLNHEIAQNVRSILSEQAIYDMRTMQEMNAKQCLFDLNRATQQVYELRNKTPAADRDAAFNLKFVRPK